MIGRECSVRIKSESSQKQTMSDDLQQKLSVVRAEIDLIREVTGETPILLLDDVASELDKERNSFFFNYLSEQRGQVFVTATDADSIGLSGTANTRVFTIESGRLKTS